MKRGKTGPRLLLITNRELHNPIIAFNRYQNQRPWMTLDSVYALCFKI